ncbi:ATP-dependent zinc metalloprotease FTSH 7 chloroplastic [Zea mays]|uniref:ATP-dependent zinc metalloprotease FTSH 7 chloroplastic n=1 Tax=Zea mays TaxID=4577 RepID=A0A1D6HER6_MAIZE|nr:ATP-dependent zinc metalloprotease FTSH 7 chloroplastic [Zea mays]AQK73142.1 ATP-dependent zinc metalloprotease FTSH 7 chloroplastic [Zea mays]AQK73144.1 ATP-dependent zinc metalloprotease FTSH 7 chloroplastic [Zea mays]
MASAAAETLASFPIASPSRSLLRPFPRRPAGARTGAPSIRISAVPPRGLGLALVHRRCPPAARANVERDGDGASGNGEPSSSSGDGDRDAAAESGGDSTSTSTTSTAATPPPPSSKRNENKWRRRLTKGGGVGRWLWEPIVQGREMGFLLLQLGFAIFALRMLRPEIALPGSEPRPQTTYVSVPYSDFLASINKDQVKKVEVDGVHIMFRLRPEVESQVRVEQTPTQRGADYVIDNAGVSRRIVFTTTRPVDIKTPYEKMVENMVEFGSPDKRSGGMLNSALVGLIYVVLIAVVLQRLPISFSQQSPGQLRNRKNSNSGGAKVSESSDIVTFADVAGVDEAKEELEEIVEFLRNPERYIRLGARPPRGVLLIDAVAKSRDSRYRIVSNDEREQTLNQLLTEMDGFDTNSAVIVLGATNRADVLDPALRRPGRFDRVVMVEAPDRFGRESILKVHVKRRELPLSKDVDLANIAAMTTGFTGADLANLVNEAALLAGRLNKEIVEKVDFIRAVERSIAGIEKKHAKLKGNEKAVVARHEVGHALVGTAVANLLPGQPRVEKLSILPRSGGALGFTYTPPVTEDRYLLFVDELRGRLVTLLGGRAAEEVVLAGRVSTGALDDIRRATDMAYKAVAEYGLSQRIGPISLATLSNGGLDDSGGSPWGKDQGHLVDLVQREVKALLQSSLEVALSVIRANPAVLEGLGAYLEEKEKVEGEELQEWLKSVVASKELTSFIRGQQEQVLQLEAGS